MQICRIVDWQWQNSNALYKTDRTTNEILQSNVNPEYFSRYRYLIHVENLIESCGMPRISYFVAEVIVWFFFFFFVFVHTRRSRCGGILLYGLMNLEEGMSECRANQ